MIKPFNDDERSRGSSLDDEFLNYLSGDIPPPIPPPPPPPAASMAPASAASETNQSLVELMVMSAMARMADAGVPPAERASRQKTLARKMADAPVGSTPADLAGVLARALLEMAEAGAEALDPWDSAAPPPAAAAAAARDDNLHPPPSAPPIELLIKDELFDGTPPPANRRPAPHAPPPPGGPSAAARGRGSIPTGGNRHAADTDLGRAPTRPSEADRARERMVPLSEAVVINMPVCEAVRMAPPPAPAQDEEGDSGGEENDALVGCSIRCGKVAMIRLLFLGLVAVIVVVAMVLVLKRDDPVTTNTSSTAASTGTMSTAIVTSTRSTSSTTTPEMNTVSAPPMSTAIVTSTSSTSSTTTPKMNTVSAPPVTTSLWEQQGSAIVGDAAEDYLGTSVALSADAKTLVVGAPGLYGNNDREGYVKIYRMTDDGGSRTQLGQTIYGNKTGDLFGYSVDVSAQGNVILLSSLGYYNYTGYVQVFSLDSDDETAGTTGTWKQVGQDIAGEAIGDEFGQSVSISDDGKTIAVGAPDSDGKNGEESGHVRIYRLADDGASWEQIGGDIDGDAALYRSGISVSLSANGTIVAIMATQAGIDGVLRSGQVKVYRIDSGGSSWEQLGESIYGDNENDWYGWSVDISPDGNSLAFGMRVSDGPGYVKVFSLENGGGDGDDLGASSWKQVGLTITGEANGDRFGNSVSLSDDAKTLAVGARLANGEDGDDVGHVRVYRRDDSESGWTQIGEDIDGEADGDNSGQSVSLSGDGKTMAIGSHRNGDNGEASGHVRVFVAE